MEVRQCRVLNCHKLVELPHYYCDEHRELEAAYLQSRMKWSHSHDKQYAKRYDKTKRVATPIKREQHKFYKSKQWQDLRTVVLNKQHYLCQYCLTEGRVTQGNTIDHTIPINFDPTKKDDVNNLNVICPECHRLKTDWEYKHYYLHGKRIVSAEAISNVKEVNYLMRQSDGNPQTGNAKGFKGNTKNSNRS
ncbi:hypothetical protein X282_08480 [Oenococcus oeni IOEB_0608]|nr:hypothetical protein X282_08480 [Oenococcus oeni IOEB_0608]